MYIDETKWIMLFKLGYDILFFKRLDIRRERMWRREIERVGILLGLAISKSNWIREESVKRGRLGW